MAYYSQWYEQSVSKSATCKNKKGKAAQAHIIFDKSQTDLMAAQVTVSSVQDKFVYNLEFVKPTSSTATGLFSTEFSTNSHKTSSSSNAYYTFPQRPTSSQSEGHTRTGSTVSDTYSTTSATSQLSEDSLWDDWIVKFISSDERQQIIDEDSLEEWIFDTTS
ncbi:374_t:CDS:1 [Ambispora leptoticha]|uniref:374_t:CDS:1 n=1 Tax=Ambispora leptoticha TaxID=144679 RepID=A0A9N9D1I5_9GLOM|nr:374_t:CDS:1 [Ambispora leptoticha]